MEWQERQRDYGDRRRQEQPDAGRFGQWYGPEQGGPSRGERGYSSYSGTPGGYERERFSERRDMPGERSMPPDNPYYAMQRERDQSFGGEPGGRGHERGWGEHQPGGGGYGHGGYRGQGEYGEHYAGGYAGRGGYGGPQGPYPGQRDYRGHQFEGPWQGGYGAGEGRRGDYGGPGTYGEGERGLPRERYGGADRPGAGRHGMEPHSGAEYGGGDYRGEPGEQYFSGRGRPGYRGAGYGKGPKNYKRSDERIQEEVCDMLMGAHELDASEIEVAVNDREVTLKGTVPSRNDKWEAEQLAEAVLGVEEVMNHIRVRRDRESDQAAHEARPKTAPSDAGNGASPERSSGSRSAGTRS